MRVDLLPERLRQHLGPEADAEKRRLLAQRHLDPPDLLGDERVGIVRTHRAAEDDGARMVRHGGGQRVAEARAADIKPMVEPEQQAADAPGRGMLLVQDDEDGRFRGDDAG